MTFSPIFYENLQFCPAIINMPRSLFTDMQKEYLYRNKIYAHENQVSYCLCEHYII